MKYPSSEKNSQSSLEQVFKSGVWIVGQSKQLTPSYGVYFNSPSTVSSLLLKLEKTLFHLYHKHILYQPTLHCCMKYIYKTPSNGNVIVVLGKVAYTVYSASRFWYPLKLWDLHYNFNSLNKAWTNNISLC